jgi:hypothetical protein
VTHKEWAYRPIQTRQKKKVCGMDTSSWVARQLVGRTVTGVESHENAYEDGFDRVDLLLDNGNRIGFRVLDGESLIVSIMNLNGIVDNESVSVGALDNSDQ